MEQAHCTALHIRSPKLVEAISDNFAAKETVFPFPGRRHRVHMAAEHQARWMTVMGDYVKAPTFHHLLFD